MAGGLKMSAQLKKPLPFDHPVGGTKVTDLPLRLDADVGKVKHLFDFIVRPDNLHLLFVKGVVTNLLATELGWG